MRVIKVVAFHPKILLKTYIRKNTDISDSNSHQPTGNRSNYQPSTQQCPQNKILYTSVLYCTVRESKLPKAGFKSITVAETVYDKFQDVYQKNKDNLAMKGVNSFSGYVTYMLEEMMQKDKTFARYAPKIEKISVDDDRVILKDNILTMDFRNNRIIQAEIDNEDISENDFNTFAKEQLRSSRALNH